MNKLKVLTFIICLLPLWGLIIPGLPVTHDGQDHVARIANFYQSLSEGNIVPRWAANLNWGYGHPILMFLYPLPSYAASFIHLIGFSFVDSTKVVFGISYLISILAMYLWISRWLSKPAGLVTALLYGFAPYRFVDLYVRGALGEHVAFIFPPLICLSLLLLAKEHARSKVPPYGILISIFSAGLILSHNALSLMFLPLIFFYAVYLYFFETKKDNAFLVLILCYIFIGFVLSAFFWIPAFFEGKYTLRDIVTKDQMIDRFVPWMWFFYSPWNYGGGDQFSKQVGIVQWIGILSGVIAYAKAKEKNIRILLIGLGLLFISSLFIMTSEAHIIWEHVSLLQKFQFPWRFLSVSVFLSAVIGGVTISRFPKKYYPLIVISTLIFVGLSTYQMWKPPGYQMKPESYYTGIYKGTTDTGESSPIWSVRFMEKEPEHRYQIIQGQGIVKEIFRNTTTHLFSINLSTRSRILDNTLYFPGWQVSIDGKRLDITNIEYQDPAYRGLMSFWSEPGIHTVKIEFVDTKLRSVSAAVSLLGLCLLIGMIGIDKANMPGSRNSTNLL